MSERVILTVIMVELGILVAAQILDQLRLFKVFSEVQ